jgi:hypothetical protein
MLIVIDQQHAQVAEVAHRLLCGGSGHRLASALCIPCDNLPEGEA